MSLECLTGIFVARYYDLFEKAMMISNEIKKK